MALVTIITPTYNKAEYFADGIRSVLDMAFKDWVWWIILDNSDQATEELVTAAAMVDSRIRIFSYTFPEIKRWGQYRPAVYMNEFFPLVKTKYFYWLSDDDTLYPYGLQRMVDELEANSDWDVVYGGCEIFAKISDGSWAYSSGCFSGRDIGLGTGIMPLCEIDGGQILQTKRSYDALNGWQLGTVLSDSSCCDGVYMNQLAEKFVFHWVNVAVVKHRRTPLSTFTSPKAVGDIR